MCAVSEARFQRKALDPLKGIRVLASTSIVLIHVGWLCGYASSAWRWYDVLAQKFWPNAVLGFHGFLSMHAFFVMTGTTSAASLLPTLSRLKQADRWQAVKSYWIRRASRIVPPYFCMILACILTSLWLAHHPWSSTFEGQQLGYFFAQVPLREVWAHLCFLNNAMCYSLTSVWSWNLAIQVQFWLAFPLIVLALRPGSPQFRKRLGCGCLVSMTLATAWRVWVVHTCNLSMPLSFWAAAAPLSASAGHSALAQSTIKTYVSLMYTSLFARAMDLAAGVLIYLAATGQPLGHQGRPKVHVLCSVIAAFGLAWVCLQGPSIMSPVPDPNVRLGSRLMNYVVLQGLLCPLSVAYLIFYVISQPDGPSTWLASVLSLRRWDFLAARSYSVSLLHPLMIFWLFRLVPVSSMFGALEKFDTFAAIFSIVWLVSHGLSWLQDVLLKAAMEAIRSPLAASSTLKQAYQQVHQHKG